MNKRIKELWVAALRSGEYVQGKGNLRNIENRFCCLGVLCDLFIKENPTKARWQDGGSAYAIMLDDSGLSEYSWLPSVVINWAGLIGFGCGVRLKNHPSLAYCNDTSCLTFPQIADIIEKEISSDE